MHIDFDRAYELYLIGNKGVGKMDKKDIQMILKNEGLDVAEDMVGDAVKAAIKLLRLIVPKLSAGFGLALNMFLDVYEPKIFEMIDKIDGRADA